jgi:two-component SAPR family response regulator
LLASLPTGPGSPANPTVLTPQSRPVEGRRILVVEDEALVGMLMKDLLAELDFAVIGPFANISDAAAGLLVDEVAAALLDVNLAGEPIYPFAARIAERGIPLIFVTDYIAEAIDERFAAVPVLQKPIEREALRAVLSVTAAERTVAA